MPSILKHVSTPLKSKRRDFQAYSRRKKDFRRLENALKEEVRRKAAKKAKEAEKSEQPAKDQPVRVGEKSEAGVQTQLSLEDIGYMEEKF